MNYSIKINEFEGPLDLLLHLIKTADMDIYNISIDDITKDYLSYINEMEQLNINIAAEYLVMAAELMEIKSKSLLPHKKEQIIEDDEEISKENLINKLIEYKKYKEMMPTFKDLESWRKKVYIKSPETLKNYLDTNHIPAGNSNPDDLFKAFLRFLDRKEKEKPLSTKITSKEYSVKERKSLILGKLNDRKKISLDDLIEVADKSILVVTFISILELAKENSIYIRQSNNFADVYIERRDKDERSN